MPFPDTGFETLDLSKTYLHLAISGAVTPLTVGPGFWTDMPSILATGRMVSLLKHDCDWPSWEKHPVGEEVIVQLTGHMRLRLALPEGERSVALAAGRCAVVPVNIWHTADISEPSSALYITEGQGTEVRPR